MDKDLTYNQPSSKPSRKMEGVAVSGAVITALVTLLSLFGIVIPEEVSSAALSAVVAITSIVTFIVGYFRKERVPRP